MFLIFPLLFGIDMSILMSMDMIDYKSQFDAIFKRMAEIVRQRSDLEAEAEKLQALVFATANMVSDEDRQVVLDKWMKLCAVEVNSAASLTESIRGIFQGAGRERMTVTDVRNRLMAAGFDFSGYISNPLASVSAVLKRLAAKNEIEPATIQGVTSYRKKRRRLPSYGARNSLANTILREKKQ